MILLHARRPARDSQNARVRQSRARIGGALSDLVTTILAFQVATAVAVMLSSSAGANPEDSDHIRRHLPGALNTDAEVTEVRPAGHHVRAHAVAEVRTSTRGFRLFLKLVKPARKGAELFAYDRLLPTAFCSSPRVVARFPDWEWPTVWLALEHLDGRWASTEPADRSRTISAVADLHATGFLTPELALADDAPRLDLSELSSMYDQVEGEEDYLHLDPNRQRPVELPRYGR